MKICSISGCEREVKARTWCKLHYYRWYYNGSPSALKIRERGTGKLNPDGRAIVSKNGRERPATHWIAEKAIGQALPATAIVHHVNGNPADDINSNLVICPDQAYHMLLHRRQRALEACGDANWRICKFCKKYDSPDNLYINGKHVCHRTCNAANQRLLRIERKSGSASVA